jgi:hypothetical protein
LKPGSGKCSFETELRCIAHPLLAQFCEPGLTVVNCAYAQPESQPALDSAKENFRQENN